LRLTENQIANDFASLYRVFRSYDNLASGRLVGPDIVAFPSIGSSSYKIVQAVVNVTGAYLKAVTFHHYYFEGDIAKYEKYLDPSNFDNLAKTIGS